MQRAFVVLLETATDEDEAYDVFDDETADEWEEWIDGEHIYVCVPLPVGYTVRI